MKFKLLILGLAWLLQVGPLFPQTPSYYHYTTADGLASSTVYDILQDREGFIWFGTMNGISRFDGETFFTYRMVDGLNSNSIISLEEGSGGELYIGNYEKGVNLFRNGQIENYCSEIDGKPFAISYLLLVPSGKNEQKLYAYRSWGAINVIQEFTSGDRFGYSLAILPRHLIKIEQLHNGDLIGLTANGLYTFNNETFSKLIVPRLPDTAFYCFANSQDGSFLVGTQGMIYKIKNNRIVKSYEISFAGNNGVSAILEDRNGNTWFSIMNKGFYFIPRGSDRMIDMGKKMGIENTLVNKYLEDREGNIWVSAFGKGVFCLNNLFLKTFDEHDGLSNNNVYSILKHNSGIVLIGTFNGLDLLEEGRFDRIKSNSGNTLTDNIFSIKNISNDFYICGTFGGDEIINFSYRGMNLHMFDRPSFCKTKLGLYLFGTGVNSLLVRKELNAEFEGPFLLPVFGDSLKINRVNEVFEDPERNVWIGTGLGLCKVTNLEGLWGVGELKKRFFADNPVLNARINAICQDHKQHIWFAGEKGIAFYSPENDSMTTYMNIDGYDLSSSTALAVDNKERTWIGNMKGLYLFDGSSIRLLNRQTGLPSGEILSLYYDDKKNILYIGTSNGIALLDVDLFDNYHPSPPDVIITGIKAVDSVFTDYTNLVFNATQHDVYIDFKALHFSSPGSVKYMYNLNDEWIETSHDFLNLISLPHGTYMLQIKAKAENTGWGESTVLTFRVIPRFVETTWFNLLIGFMIAGISFLVINWRLRINSTRIRKESELTERFNKLEHQALSAMMNPHFISNSLNSVQYLVNSGRYEEANNYIAMMAKLMRKNLDTAGSGFILLSEEIFRLKLYLDLEKLRFQDGFSYEIIAGKDVDANAIMIPNMIIQPFVENSLWHGIINTGNKGLLTVSFTFEEVDIDSFTGRSLIIKVTDNGIGITEAKKSKKEDHISKGIQIIEERLRLLSTKLHLPQPIIFEDLSSPNSTAHGTEVIISLSPPLYQITSPDSNSPSSHAG